MDKTLNLTERLQEEASSLNLEPDSYVNTLYQKCPEDKHRHYEEKVLRPLGRVVR